jgi:LasA protease
MKVINQKHMSANKFVKYKLNTIILLLAWLLTSCQAAPEAAVLTEVPTQAPTPAPLTTPLPTRPAYSPGELVDYAAQPGDSLAALAAHFGTDVNAIRAANPILPRDVTTLPSGLPMKIPVYFNPTWGSPYQILPDSLFVNGPAQIGFNIEQFVNSRPGWLKNYEAYTGDQQRRGGQLVQYVAENFSVSPRLLLAIIEYQTGALSQSGSVPEEKYPLGFVDAYHQGLYRQLVWAANQLNNGYYGWRTGSLTSIERLDGRLEAPDPWQNAATVGLHYYYASLLRGAAYEQAIHGAGLINTYTQLFGDPWKDVQANIPGSLTQPEMLFPFTSGSAWTFTGGPHTGWGEGEPLAALDFAPPSVVGGCSPSEDPTTAMAAGLIVRTEPAEAVLDLDADGDERTGWVIFYLHLALEGVPTVGTHLNAGDAIGFPSCEVGRATGTHVHVARKYNGEWIPADGAIPFNLEGWLAKQGKSAYEGSLVRFSRTVTACVCSNMNSQVIAGELILPKP